MELNNAARATANAQRQANAAAKNVITAQKRAAVQAAVNTELAERKRAENQQVARKNTTRKNHGKSVGNARKALAKAFGWK